MEKYEWSEENYVVSDEEKRTIYRCKDFPRIALVARGGNERAVSICWWVSTMENMTIKLNFGYTSIEKAKRLTECGNLEKIIDALRVELL